MIVKLWILEEYWSMHESGAIKGVFDSEEKAIAAKVRIEKQGNIYEIYQVPLNKVVNVERYINRDGSARTEVELEG